MVSGSSKEGEQSWRIKHHVTVTSSKIVTYPALIWTNAPDYLKVVTEYGTAFLRTEARRGGEGRVLFVARNTLKDMPAGGAGCTVQEIGKLRWNIERTLRDARGRVGLLALAAGIVGTVIQGAVTAGKIKAYFVMTENQLAVLSIVGYFLQTIALVLLFMERELLKTE